MTYGWENIGGARGCPRGRLNVKIQKGGTVNKVGEGMNDLTI